MSGYKVADEGDPGTDDAIVFFHKPFTGADLLLRVREILDSNRWLKSHAVGIHRDRFNADLKREAEHWNILAAARCLPNLIVAFHQAKERAHDLTEHAGQVCSRVFGIVDLRS